MLRENLTLPWESKRGCFLSGVVFLPPLVLLKYADCNFPLAINWDLFNFILFVYIVSILHGQNLLSSYVNAVFSIPHLISALYTLITYYMLVSLEGPCKINIPWRHRWHSEEEKNQKLILPFLLEKYLNQNITVVLKKMQMFLFFLLSLYPFIYSCKIK